MDQSLQVALGVSAVVLVALLIGVLIPVLLSLRATLRQARQFLIDTTCQLDQTVGAVTGIIEKADRVMGDLEPRVQAVGQSLDEAQKILKVVVAVGTSVGPAITAAVRAYAAARHDGHDEGEIAGMHGYSGPIPGG